MADYKKVNGRSIDDTHSGQLETAEVPTGDDLDLNGADPVR